jgi:hypothetical protein
MGCPCFQACADARLWEFRRAGSVEQAAVGGISDVRPPAPEQLAKTPAPTPDPTARRQRLWQELGRGMGREPRPAGDR